MDNLCPFVNNAETKKTADARINNGLVCDILRTTL